MYSLEVAIPDFLHWETLRKPTNKSEHETTHTQNTKKTFAEEADEQGTLLCRVGGVEATFSRALNESSLGRQHRTSKCLDLPKELSHSFRLLACAGKHDVLFLSEVI